MVSYCCFVLPHVLAETFLPFAPMKGNALGFKPSAADNHASRAMAFLPLLLPALSPNCLITCCLWLFYDSIHLPWSHTSQGQILPWQYSTGHALIANHHRPI